MVGGLYITVYHFPCEVRERKVSTILALQHKLELIHIERLSFKSEDREWSQMITS